MAGGVVAGAAGREYFGSSASAVIDGSDTRRRRDDF